MTGHWRKLLAAAAILLIALAACSSPPKQGYVYSINYNPPSSYYVPGYDYSNCYGSSSRRHCYEEWEPGRTVYVPPEWQIELCAKPGKPDSANKCGWRDVDEQTWHSVRLGQYWTTVASS
jgi:hypothetical protein